MAAEAKVKITGDPKDFKDAMEDVKKSAKSTEETLVKEVVRRKEQPV